MQHLKDFLLKGLFPKLNQQNIDLIQKDVSDEEIKKAIFNREAYKAQGSDGLQPIFFQIQWEIVGQLVCEIIKRLFQDSKQVESINQTFLVLIPKMKKPENMKHFRPISLCNVVYKIIMKIFASRLKIAWVRL